MHTSGSHGVRQLGLLWFDIGLLRYIDSFMFFISDSAENINEAKATSVLNLLFIVIGPSALALILILILAKLLASGKCCKGKPPVA